MLIFNAILKRFKFAIKMLGSLFLKKFPYVIHYRLVDKTITIIALFHTSQNSDNWIRR